MTWTDTLGHPHRLDGPVHIRRGPNSWSDELHFEWAIHGKQVTMAQVYGRFMEAMSDGVIASTDMDTLKKMVDSGALVVDEATKAISVGDHREFNAIVDRHARLYVIPDVGESRPVEVYGQDDRYDDWDEEYMDGQWNLHRPFGKAIPTQRDYAHPWWWRGEGVSFGALILESLAEASDGAIAKDNYDAMIFVAENSEVEVDGRVVLSAYRHHPWKELAGAIAQKFPNPKRDDTSVRRVPIFDGPRERTGVRFVKDRKNHREDGPAAITFRAGADPIVIYALDGEQVTREHILSRVIQASTGRYVSPKNTDAFEHILRTIDVDFGDEENDYAITFPTTAAPVVDLALMLHFNIDD